TPTYTLSLHDALPICHLPRVLPQALGGLLQRQARAYLSPQLVAEQPLNLPRHAELPERALRAQPLREPEAAHALPLEDERARVNDAALQRERAVDDGGAPRGHRAQHAPRQLARHRVERDGRAQARAEFDEPLVELFLAAVEGVARALAFEHLRLPPSAHDADDMDAAPDREADDHATERARRRRLHDRPGAQFFGSLQQRPGRERVNDQRGRLLDVGLPAERDAVVGAREHELGPGAVVVRRRGAGHAVAYEVARPEAAARRDHLAAALEAGHDGQALAQPVHPAQE